MSEKPCIHFDKFKVIKVPYKLPDGTIDHQANAGVPTSKACENCLNVQECLMKFKTAHHLDQLCSLLREQRGDNEN